MIIMKCPYCSNEDTKVVDKRDGENFTRRRRECLKCEKRFTTYERPEISLIVIKKDGRREQFDREKLKAGIVKACEKRPVSMEKIGDTVDDIEIKLRKMNSTEIPSTKIGELVTEKMDDDANVIWGARVSESMKGKITVMTIITGVVSPWILGREDNRKKSSAARRMSSELGIEML